MPHTRPAQASRALRPAGLLNRPRRPLSRGSSPVSCPTKPLVSYRSNRQLSGWNPPPLVIRAVGAHWGMRAQKAEVVNFDTTVTHDLNRAFERAESDREVPLYNTQSGRPKFLKGRG